MNNKIINLIKQLENPEQQIKEKIQEDKNTQIFLLQNRIINILYYAETIKQRNYLLRNDVNNLAKLTNQKPEDIIQKYKP
jgi:hypothetical protein